jgi:hypothetical protein
MTRVESQGRGSFRATSGNASACGSFSPSLARTYAYTHALYSPKDCVWG